MVNYKEQIIEKTGQMVGRLNNDIHVAIDEDLGTGENPSSFMVKRHGRMHLECNTEKVLKYIRITRDGSVVAFVCSVTGNVYMPASRKAPAKHARGNVFSELEGREAFTSVDPSGLVHVKYLK